MKASYKLESTAEFTDGMTEMPFTLKIVADNGAEIAASGTLGTDLDTVTYDMLNYTDDYDEEFAKSMVDSCLLTLVKYSGSIMEKNTTISLADYGFGK